jgi:hypothetical protein
VTEALGTVDFLNPFLNVSTPQRLLIIAPDEFIPALTPLAKHKNETGMPAFLVSISSLGRYFTGEDDPEIIKRAIRYAHEKLETKYVMLVGDAHKFPVRFFFIHNIPADYSEWTKLGIRLWEPLGQWFASDLYYANLYRYDDPPSSPVAFDDWNANRNGLYNEGDWDAPLANPDLVSGYPDVAVGRIPAHTADDVAAYVAKVISYESARFERRCNFTFVHDWAYGKLNLSIDLASTEGTLGTRLSTVPGTRYLLIENPVSTTMTPIPGQSGMDWENATADDVIRAANESGWVSYVGHGGPSEWGLHHTLMADDVPGTSGSNAWPVVFAVGCSTGRFIPDLPFNGDYVDSSGQRHGPLQIQAPSRGFSGFADLHGPIVSDGATGQQWALRQLPPGWHPLPALVPTPDAYDYDRGDQGFAYTWLLGSAPGGAIAYFGEMGVTTDAQGKDLEKYILANYVDEEDPILGDLVLKGQRSYWPNHNAKEGFQSASRYYLGWMVFFGDPSLRMPRVT